MDSQSRAGQQISALIEALRPHHWIKNLLVFLPMIASHQFAMPTVIHSMNAFVSFSLAASAVYVLNDIHDVALDRSHQRKKNRPIASGRISKQASIVLSLVLLITAAYFAARLNLAFQITVSFYCCLAVAYTWVLKRIAYLDVIVLTGFYCSRIVAGGAATGIELSYWLLLFSACIFLALASVKRQAELINTGSKHPTWRIKGRGYGKDDLPVLRIIAHGAGLASVFVLAFYFFSPTVAGIYRNPSFLWLICVVLAFWLVHIFKNTARGSMHDDPVVFATTDRWSLVCLLLIAALVGLAVFA